MIRRHTLKVVSIDLLALVALVGAVAWFCEGMLFEGKSPFFRDLVTYSYPINFSLSKSFLAGELPLWDHHMAAGFPLLAAFQPGVFYPPSLLFYLLPFFDAIRWTFFVHFLIAAFGAYFLSRRWKCPTHLSLIGAVLFAFGGTIVSLSNLLNHFQSAVWLPWMILCGERFLHAASWQNFVLLIFVLLCALLAGSPEIYVFSIGLLLINGIRLSVCNGKQGVPRVLLSLFAAKLVVAALGMVQFLPTLELLLQSRRDQPIPFHEATLWSLNPISLIGLFVPDKEADSSLSLGVRLFFARDVPFLLSHYLGVLNLGARKLYAGLSIFVRANSPVSYHTISGEVLFHHLHLPLVRRREGFSRAPSVERFRAKIPGLRSFCSTHGLGNGVLIVPLVSGDLVARDGLLVQRPSRECVGGDNGCIGNCQFGTADWHNRRAIAGIFLCFETFAESRPTTCFPGLDSPV